MNNFAARYFCISKAMAAPVRKTMFFMEMKRVLASSHMYSCTRDHHYLTAQSHPYCPYRPHLSTSLCSAQSTCIHKWNNHGKQRNFVIQQRNFSRDSLSYYVSSDFPPIHYLQEFFMLVHDTTGLPWWATIAVSTLAIRTALFPFAAYCMYNDAKVRSLQTTFKQMSVELKAEVDKAARMLGWPQKVSAAQFRVNMRRLIKETYIKENCHPMKAPLIVLLQLPLWFCCSFALRNMTGMQQAYTGKAQSVMVPDLATGGTLWFTDLLVPDPTFILPVLLAAMNLLIIEIHAVRRGATQGRMGRVVTNSIRFFSLLMVPIAAIMPSCMPWYWLCSSTCGLAQNLLFLSPRVQRVLRIPDTKQSETPYRDIYHGIKNKFTPKMFRKEQDSS